MNNFECNEPYMNINIKHELKMPAGKIRDVRHGQPRHQLILIVCGPSKPRIINR